MGQNEKTPAGDAAGVKGHDDDDVNRRQYTNANGSRKQAERSAKDSWQRDPVFLIAEDISKLKITVEAACKCKTQGEAAEVYIEHGIPVFPCDWRPKKGSTKASKAPLCKNGLYGADSDAFRPGIPN
jgi:hypothetical protein